MKVGISKLGHQVIASNWLILLMRPARLERATFWFVARSSHLAPIHIWRQLLTFSTIGRIGYAGHLCGAGVARLAVPETETTRQPGEHDR